MAQEFETKILDINVEAIEQKLMSLGAVLKEDTTLMKRRVFDIKAHTVDGFGSRIRLRQKGEKATITYKERNGNAVGATKELETEVKDFETMAEILQTLPRETMVYQENKRKLYLLNDTEFCIDSWPHIPTYLEIEGLSKEKVAEGLNLLGLNENDVGDMGVLEIYKHYGIDLHAYKVLKFEDSQ